MSWENVPQAVSYAQTVDTRVTVALVEFRGGTRLCVVLLPDLLARLGWAPDQRLALRVGRGPLAGKVAVTPDPMGRALATAPRSTKRIVKLEVSNDLARWEAPRRPAEFEVEPANGTGPHTLVITLPWDLSGEPPADAETDGAASAAAA
jgi:hypothetical protein